ncbi:HAD-IA family hydrolase [Streptomyces sp. NPDC046925]|uniref:HAD-IA family hydrolase n=1 Tax=Streptomyces sp. NPDC046925 TaxID=3155375 RepID=UPI0033F4924C
MPDSPASTDVVLFDLFGVIARHQSAEGKDRLVRTAEVPAPAFWDAYWARRQPYDQGELTGPAYWLQVADTLAVDFGERRIAELVEADVASWSAVDETMVALVEELAASGRRIALLSNIPEELASYYEAHHHWLKHFPLRAFSCRTGHAKPDPGAYQWCLHALNTDPQHVFFVDDREENIRAAQKTGIRGHLFTDPQRLKAVL